jgi:hypothetical protein
MCVYYVGFADPSLAPTHLDATNAMPPKTEMHHIAIKARTSRQKGQSREKRAKNSNHIRPGQARKVTDSQFRRSGPLSIVLTDACLTTGLEWTDPVIHPGRPGQLVHWVDGWMCLPYRLIFRIICGSYSTPPRQPPCPTGCFDMAVALAGRNSF